MIDIIATILTVIGLAYCIKHMKKCWLFWSAANFFWCVKALSDNKYPSAVIIVLFTAAYIFGYRSWKRDGIQ